MSHNASPSPQASDHKTTASVPPLTNKVEVDANPIPIAPIPSLPRPDPQSTARSPSPADSPASDDDVSDSDEPTSNVDVDSDSDSDSDSGIYRPSPYFDTSSSSPSDGLRTVGSLDDIAALLKTAKNVIILVGAGCSVSAGIPDFRSPETGLYANLARFNLPAPEAIFDLSFFKTKPEPFFMLCKDLYPGKHLPTPAHYFFRLLHEHGVLKRVFTQNIDTLETTAGLPRSAIVEAHGSFATSHCIKCHRETPHEEMVDRVRKGEVVRCRQCGGLVKPDIVFFGEGLPTEFFQKMRTDLPQCDLLLVIGTSLQVHPFASLINYVPRSCPRILINKEKVGEASGRWDDGGFRFEQGSRDFFWGGEADVGVRHLAEKLGWKNELDDLVRTHRAELRKEWGIVPGDSEIDAESGSATSPSSSPAVGEGVMDVRTSAADEDRIEEVLATLADDLKKVGLEEEVRKSEL